MVYVIQVCWQLASRIRIQSDSARKLSANLYDIYHCVQWKTPDDGQTNSPKHVEFYSKNKFEKLVHLVGFIIRMYHDARSPERQICHLVLNHSVFIVTYYTQWQIRFHGYRLVESRAGLDTHRIVTSSFSIVLPLSGVLWTDWIMWTRIITVFHVWLTLFRVSNPAGVIIVEEAPGKFVCRTVVCGT